MIKYIELTRAEALTTQLQEAQFYKITDLGLTNVVSYTSHAVSVGDAETPTLCPVGTVETIDGKFITGRYDLTTNTVTAYLEIELLLTQSSGDAPTITELKNESGITFTSSYYDVGIYNLNSSESLSSYSQKVIIIGNAVTDGTDIYPAAAIWDSDNGQFDIFTRKLSDNSLTDNGLRNNYTIIKLYL